MQMRGQKRMQNSQETFEMLNKIKPGGSNESINERVSGANNSFSGCHQSISCTIPLLMSHYSFMSTWQVSLKTVNYQRSLKKQHHAIGLCVTLQLLVKQAIVQSEDSSLLHFSNSDCSNKFLHRSIGTLMNVFRKQFTVSCKTFKKIQTIPGQLGCR